MGVLLLAVAACTREIGTVDDLPLIGPTQPDPGQRLSPDPHDPFAAAVE